MQERNHPVQGIQRHRPTPDVDSYGYGASALTQSSSDDPYGADYEVAMSEDLAEDDPEMVQEMAKPMIVNTLGSWMSDWQNNAPRVATV